MVAADTELLAVVSQPDRPAGRGREPAAPAVKLAAVALGVPVLQPEKLRTPEIAATLAAYAADVFVVVAYGRILPQALLDLPRLGPYNVHASLLPRLRGAAPIQWSIIRGDARDGRIDHAHGGGARHRAGRGDARAADRATTTRRGRCRRGSPTLGAALLRDTLPAIADGRRRADAAG